jgi:sugar phosphate isomerase/epimerase
MQRREFMQGLGAAAAGAFFTRADGPAPGRLERIGLELYSVRRAMAKDPERTLAAVAAMGYTDVELLWSFDNFGRSPEQVAATLKQEGLRAPSAHVPETLIQADLAPSLEKAKLLGHQYLVVPSFDPETTRTVDDWLRWADRFNAAGTKAREAGIWLAFHNEPDHMKPIGGVVPYDAFVQRLDPSLVRLQLDTGNMVMGGADPMKYLAAYRDRYWTFHLKDVVADHSGDTELGRGVVDFKALLAAVPELEHKPCFVEQEGPSDELAAARSDLAYLRGLEF